MWKLGHRTELLATVPFLQNPRMEFDGFFFITVNTQLVWSLDPPSSLRLIWLSYAQSARSSENSGLDSWCAAGKLQWMEMQTTHKKRRSVKSDLTSSLWAKQDTLGGRTVKLGDSLLMMRWWCFWRSVDNVITMCWYRDNVYNVLITCW